MVRGRQLSAALGREYAVAALLVLRDRPGLGVTQLAAAVGANLASGRTIATHLERYGLATVEEDLERGVAGKPRYVVSLTPLGRAVVDTLEPLLDLVPDPSPDDAVEVDLSTGERRLVHD